MAIYNCIKCDNYIDDDYNPGTEYDNDLICQFCIEDIYNEVEAIVGTDQIDEMTEAEVLEWYKENIE